MIYACEHHDEVLDRWRREDRRGIALCHVDSHDDLRRLRIDRSRGVAYAIGALSREATLCCPWILGPARALLRAIGSPYSLRHLTFPLYRWIAHDHYALGMRGALTGGG